MPPQQRRSFRELLRQFCLNTTFQGFKYFYIYPDPLSRCFWLVNVVGALSFAVVLGMLLYTRFAQMPTRITIEDQYSPVTQLPFPAITMCTPNQMSLTNIEHFNRTLVDGEGGGDLHALLRQALGYYEMMPHLDLAGLRALQDLIDLNRHFIPVVMASLPQSCAEFLRLCIFEDQIFNCSEIFQPILTKHGLCCIFNSPYRFRDFKNDRIQKLNKFMPKVGGLLGALTVVSDYNPSDAMDGTLLNAGAIRLSLNDWTEFPADDESCLIYPNQQAYIIIHGSHTYCSDEVKGLAPEIRRCQFENEGHTGLPGQGYRNSDCDLMCFVRAVERGCHCTLFFVPGVRMTHICNLTSVPCITHIKTNLALTEGLTSCDCPRDCDSRHYRVETNTGNMGAIEYMTINPFAGLKINRSTTIMNIAFSNSFYVTQKQETVMSLINLVSNLGGVFGLCMGCSAFSVLELVFFIYMAVKHKFFLKPKMQNKPQFKA